MKEFSKTLAMDIFLKNHYMKLSSSFIIYREYIKEQSFKITIFQNITSSVLILSYQCNQSFRQIVATVALYGTKLIHFYLGEYVWMFDKLMFITGSSQIHIHTRSVPQRQFQSCV